MPKNYRTEIHKLFETLRSEIEIKNELQVIRLQILERLEDKAIKENSQAALKRVVKLAEERKHKTVILKYARKRIEVSGETITVTQL